MDHELLEYLADMHQQTDAAGAACALTRWQHFSARNDAVAAILKV